MKVIGLKTYPDEPYVIFELPVRFNEKKNYYQVFNGERWHKLYITNRETKVTADGTHRPKIKVK